MFTVAAAVANAVKFPPDKPTLSHTGVGQFSITNYDPINTYVVTMNTGTFSRTGAAVTVNTGNSICTVVSYSPKGIPSTASTYERKSYSYGCRTVPQTCCGGCNCRLEGSNCSCGPAPCGPGGSPNGQCGCGGIYPCMYGSIGSIVCDTCCSDCSYTACDVLIDQPGYTNNGSEWHKIA